MKDKKVSIIIPVYNVEKYIGKCIESVCAQEYHNLQIILVDDGSHDRSGEICDKFAREDSRIKVLHQDNTGVSEARNHGLRLVEGDYVGFIDADDYVEADYVSSLVKGMEATDLSICGFYEDMDVKQIVRTVGDSKRLNQQEAMVALLEENGYRGYLWNKLFLYNKIVENNLLFDSEISVWEDVLFVFHYLCFCNNISYDPSPKYHYVYREGSASHGENVISKSYSAIIAKDKIATLIPRQYTDVREQLSVRYLTSALTVLRLCAFEKKYTDVSWYEKRAANIIRLYRKSGKNRLSKVDQLSVMLCNIHPFLFEKMYEVKNRKNDK